MLGWVAFYAKGWVVAWLPYGTFCHGQLDLLKKGHWDLNTVFISTQFQMYQYVTSFRAECSSGWDVHVPCMHAPIPPTDALARWARLHCVTCSQMESIDLRAASWYLAAYTPMQQVQSDWVAATPSINAAQLYQCSSTLTRTLK